MKKGEGAENNQSQLHDQDDDIITPENEKIAIEILLKELHEQGSLIGTTLSDVSSLKQLINLTRDEVSTLAAEVEKVNLEHEKK